MTTANTNHREANPCSWLGQIVFLVPAVSNYERQKRADEERERKNMERRKEIQQAAHEEHNNRLRQKLLDALCDGPLKTAAVVAATKQNKGTVLRVLKFLESIGKVERVVKAPATWGVILTDEDEDE